MRQPADGAHATDVVAATAARLTRPGLVVITGVPGSGRTTTLRRVATASPGPVHSGGALTALRHVPAFPLSHALRVRLPTHDVALLAEAVRSRVRHGLLVLDDLQWADPVTVAALPAVARHCRVVVALRTPHPLPAAAVDRLRGDDSHWLALPPLDPTATADLIRRTAPGLDPATVADLARRAGGNPLAATALARHRAARATAPPPDATDLDQVSYAVAAALADLTRPARTALAALGLLGRAAPAAALGEGVTELAAAGLAAVAAGLVSPVSPYQADVAAGLLDTASRRALHRRLADLVTDPMEAARHLAAAGDTDGAYRRALTAAADATTGGARADALLFACDQPSATNAVRLDAARAALATGRPRHALTLLAAAGDTGEAAALRAEALLQAGDLAAARATAAALTAGVPGHAAAMSPLAATADRVLLLADLAVDPAAATRRAAAVTARHGVTPTHVGLRAALAAVAAADRTPGWEPRLAGTAAAAAAAGDLLTARWSAWQLVETLTGDGRLTEAAHAATAAASACAADLAYSWQTRFLAARLWCLALRGDPPTGEQPTGEQPARDQPGQDRPTPVGEEPPAPVGADALPTATDALLRAATDLTDRTLPAAAHGYATATAGLLEADGGLLAAARARLAAATATTPPPGLLDWVAREAAWLDGQPDKATAPTGVAASPAVPPLIDGLRRITAHWAAHDTSTVTSPLPATLAPSLPAPAATTLAAWSAADPRRFGDAAAAWPDVSVREQVRCLLAQGLHEPDPRRAVPALLAAERIAAQAGLVVLLGRCRRALRRHAVRRDDRGTRDGDLLTGRERDVLRLVAQGEPTRRIAGQLGISTETVETHVRAGMRKLGARTRTEAAALAMETDR
ncbi:LuxR C-terminal-related transcriptional regulator [Solwaraspora sp. WMMD791]|uniref:LuxR C-terminal-related transcriptional regulator n=1 Tax=Solwaraspora sp. WMMD791 TaxID=3016086 RepID=UPI00249A82B1|nr:LuxR C-terminal-related transcriptional regulator [Solwaraspora sp. WMMD791]WFE28478.1 LuxR C-terminal-related transcriptional regulator [Solwaraspora sp. WMMD791]